MRLMLPLLLVACSGKDPGGGPTGTTVPLPSGGTTTGLPAGTPGGTTTTPTTTVFVPGPATELPWNGPAEDEDPDLILTRDGRVALVWMSRVGGNADVYITFTANGVDWDPPVQITTDVDGDFYPNLAQGDNAHYHLTWFRRQEALPYYSHVWYARSEDGMTWASGDQVLVNDDPGDIEDQVPSIARGADGAITVVFASKIRTGPNYQLYSARSTDFGVSFDAPVELSVNDPLQHDSLPYLARTGSDLALVWNRYGGPYLNAWEDSTSDVMWASSTDGLAWGTPVEITANDAAGTFDLFPQVFDDHLGNPQLLWQSTAAPLGTAYVLPVSGSYTTGLLEAPLEGYSPRIAATPTPGVFIGAWVEGAPGAQQIWTRVFTL